MKSLNNLHAFYDIIYTFCRTSRRFQYKKISISFSSLKSKRLDEQACTTIVSFPRADQTEKRSIYHLLYPDKKRRKKDKAESEKPERKRENETNPKLSPTSSSPEDDPVYTRRPDLPCAFVGSTKVWQARQIFWAIHRSVSKRFTGILTGVRPCTSPPPSAPSRKTSRGAEPSLWANLLHGKNSCFAALHRFVNCRPRRSCFGNVSTMSTVNIICRAGMIGSWWPPSMMLVLAPMRKSGWGRVLSERIASLWRDSSLWKIFLEILLLSAFIYMYIGR